MYWFDWIRFYFLRAARTQKVLLGAYAIVAFVFAISISINLAQSVRSRAVAVATPAQAVAVRPALADDVALNLPSFNAVPLVLGIERAANSTDVHIDEVTLALDDTPVQPFLRYRANFIVSGAYAPIRAFVQRVNASLPYTALESLHCTRDNIGASQVNCAIVMSALYRRGADA